MFRRGVRNILDVFVTCLSIDTYLSLAVVLASFMEDGPFLAVPLFLPSNFILQSPCLSIREAIHSFTS